MNPTERSTDWADRMAGRIYMNKDGSTRGLLDDIARALRTTRADALDQVLAGIQREQNYREYREDQDGSGIGACKEIASYVRALAKSDPDKCVRSLVGDEAR